MSLKQSAQENATKPDISTGKKTRVLFLNTRSALGADVAVHLTLIRNFDPQQVEVFVATNRNADDLDQTLAMLSKVPGLTPQVLDLGSEISAGKHKSLARISGLARNTTALFSILRLAGYVRKNHIVIVHTTDRPRDAVFGALLAKLGGCRHILHVHNKWDTWMGRATTRVASHCGGIIAISQFTRQSMLDAGLPEAKVHLCLNSTDPEVFHPGRTQPGQLRQKLGLCAQAPLVGIVARLMVWKGHLNLIEAFAEVRNAVPDAHLAIVGKSVAIEAQGGEAYEAQVQQRICDLKLDDCVHWAGWHDDIPAIMADMDIVAVPSWEEPFGLVVTEGMAMQRAIVGFDSGALPELFSHGEEGLLVTARDSHALAAALISLLQDPTRRKEMGRKGRERVLQSFTPRRQADTMTGIYRRVLAEKQKVKSIRGDK